LGANDVASSFKAPCPFLAAWAWILSLNPFGAFLLGFFKPQLYL
jgi:hypothetical protein